MTTDTAIRRPTTQARAAPRTPPGTGARVAARDHLWMHFARHSA